jgi:sortase (surface protein transpeptidase)
MGKLAGLLGAVGFAAALMYGVHDARADDSGAVTHASPLPFRVFVPSVERGPEPAPYLGPIASLDIPHAGVSSRWIVEERSTVVQKGISYLQEPTVPDRISWYPEFGRPGFRGSNTTFASHVNYVGWGLTPFANLRRVAVDDAVYITMANGTVYTYTVRSSDIVRVEDLDMGRILSPSLDEHIERVTLISCDGDLYYEPGVGGEYTSRLIVMAERYIP